MFRAMQRLSHGAVVAVGLMLIGLPVYGQVLTTGTLSGRVVDEAGLGLREVHITLRDARGDSTGSAMTDAAGAFRFRFLAPGRYEVGADRIGYGPKRVDGLMVRPGTAATATIRLAAVAQAAQAVDLEHGAAAALAGHGNTWVAPATLDALPAPRRALIDLARYASSAADDFGIEGLPGSLSSIRFDGLEIGRGASDWSALVPLVSTQSAEILTNPLDVVWGDAAGGILSAQAQRGSAASHVDARSTWSGDALPGSSITYEPGYSDIRGEASARGGVRRGTFALGLDARSVAQPMSAAWQGAAAEALIAHGDAEDVDLAAYGAPRLSDGRAWSGHGALDVPLSARHELGGRVLLSQWSAADESSALTGDGDTRGLAVIGHVRSQLSEASWNQFQLGMTSTSVEHDTTGPVPLTLVPAGLSTSTWSGWSTGDARVLSAQNVVGHRAGAHELTAGAGVRLASYDYQGARAARDGLYFGGLDELSAETGVLVRAEPADDAAEWSSTEFSAFAQDRWHAAPGLELLLGARVDAETLPRDEVAVDTTWFRLTGALNNVIDPPAVRVSPRVGVRWAAGADERVVVELGAGVYHDRFDPMLLADWQSDDGAARVRRAVGFVSWPSDGSPAGTTATHLTVLGQDFAAPRTVRLQGGVRGVLGAGLVLGVSGVVRRTDNLPRRTDLNLIPDPSTRDQYGRAVFGTLVQQGGLLAATPGTNRRFVEYDEVAALSGDGESDYWGVTLSADHDAADRVVLFARYTYSRTEDNWFGARAGGWSIALPAGLDESWAEGTSDFDVPHRIVAGLAVTAPFGIQLGALYRAQSGQPFTPSFRPGVDANGDGDARNDPAFVDPELSGMSDLLGAWSCLGESLGAFAERNSCRSDMVHTLDASASVRLFRAGGMATALVVEAFDLLDRQRVHPDDVLYLVDPTASLSVDGETVTVPLVVNPDFGSPRSYAHASRSVRVGLSLSW